MRSYINKFKTLRQLCHLNYRMIDNQIYLINNTKTLSINSLQQAHNLSTYLVSTSTTNGWSARVGMSLLFQCFLHFLPTSSTMAYLLRFPNFRTPILKVPFDMGCRPLYTSRFNHTASFIVGKDQSNRLFFIPCGNV